MGTPRCQERNSGLLPFRQGVIIDPELRRVRPLSSRPHYYQPFMVQDAACPQETESLFAGLR